jgi:hypothetical protein
MTPALRVTALERTLGIAAGRSTFDPSRLDGVEQRRLEVLCNRLVAEGVDRLDDDALIELEKLLRAARTI